MSIFGVSGNTPIPPQRSGQSQENFNSLILMVHEFEQLMSGIKTPVGYDTMQQISDLLVEIRGKISSLDSNQNLPPGQDHILKSLYKFFGMGSYSREGMIAYLDELVRNPNDEQALSAAQSLSHNLVNLVNELPETF